MKMTVTRMIGVTALAVMLAMGAGSAMAQTADSTTWEGSFEADNLPPEGNWDAIGGPGTLGAGFINFPPSGALDGVRNLNFVADSHTNGGASFEIRTRVNSGTSGTIFGHIFTSAVAGHYEWLTYYIGGGQIQINNSNSFANDNATVALDTSVFNAFRFTHDGSGWNLYFNDDATVQASLVHHPEAGEGIPYNGQFAFYHAYGGSDDVDLDYLRYTDHGAFAAPEPATMAVLGLGGLMLRRRIRNR